jgi:AmiR/NasT family two-component response regulator
MFNRLELTERKEAAQAAVKRLQERLETRKAMSRAAGILAEAQSLSHEEAIVVLLKHARESREPLLALARAVIGNEEEA